MPECRCVMGNDPAVSTQAVCDCPVHGGAGSGAEDAAEQPQTSPPDPFATSHSGNIMVLETYRGLRAAGGALVDSAFLTAAFVIANAAAMKAAGES